MPVELVDLELKIQNLATFIPLRLVHNIRHCYYFYDFTGTLFSSQM